MHLIIFLKAVSLRQDYSTGLGASLHELGHTFDLAHTPTGIMSRGFDDIYRTFFGSTYGS